jgi:FKBP-type peptidyl-prolyl cis-trans isomerase
LYKVEIIKPGKGSKCPISYECTIHYLGTLADGTVFDSTIERNSPIKFKVGADLVIRGLDKCIPQMNKGAKAILTCSPSYGYGEKGYPRVIQPNS